MTVASDWLRAKMMVVSSTRELRPLMKIYTKEITSKKIIGMTLYVCSGIVFCEFFSNFKGLLFLSVNLINIPTQSITHCFKNVANIKSLTVCVKYKEMENCSGVYILRPKFMNYPPLFPGSSNFP